MKEIAEELRAKARELNNLADEIEQAHELAIEFAKATRKVRRRALAAMRAEMAGASK